LIRGLARGKAKCFLLSYERFNRQFISFRFPKPHNKKIDQVVIPEQQLFGVLLRFVETVVLCSF